MRKWLLFVLIPIAVWAPPKEGVMSEFRAVEEGIRSKFFSEKEQQQVLENNLIRAMRNAIVRRFFREGEQYLKDLNAENLSWETVTSPNIYYVKYKYFIVRFDFANDPRFFIQAPIYEKFLLIEGFDESHELSPATNPQTPR